jgi:prepilin-type N-terminal cleavage/methylation domain-containing protein
MFHSKQVKWFHQGFTLSELLITLAVLGLIAAFTVPKMLSNSQTSQYEVRAKDTIAMITGAYGMYVQKSTLTANTTPGDLTPYMNFIAVDTTSPIDWAQTQASGNCKSTEPCLVLHNGGRLVLYKTISFGGTSSTNVILFSFDPDGRVTDGTTNGPGKALQLFLYYDGRIGTYGDIPGLVASSDGNRGVSATLVPPWFSW